MLRISQNLIQAITFLARPTLLFYALPWLMILLILGTVAQRYVGLYESERLFFGSFVLWLGPIPLPGAYSILSLIAASLTVHLLFHSRWERGRAGIILAHASALVLLAGGLMTALFRQEGYMVLAEGASGGEVSDYYQREIAVERDGKRIGIMPVGGDGKAVFQEADVPFTLHVMQFCAQCSIMPRTTTQQDLRGLAAKIALLPSLEAGSAQAQGQSGATVKVEGLPDGQNGIYVTAEALKDQPEIALGKNRYRFAIRPAQRVLPFSVRLLQFVKTDYPGTDMARSYRSDVAVKDGPLEWDAVIQMNQPLRYKGYTLYQSSFLENSDTPTTVLAVVKNAGQWFPYFSIATLCAGLLLHLILLFAGRETKTVP